MKPETFNLDVQKFFDKAYISFDNFVLLGDLNFDLMDTTKGRALRDVCDIFDLQNLTENPTCFVKDSKPSLVDVFLTNKPKGFMKSDQCDTGLRDWHNMVHIVLKVIHSSPTAVSKLLMGGMLLQDLQMVPFHVPHLFDDINDAYWAHKRFWMSTSQSSKNKKGKTMQLS